MTKKKEVTKKVAEEQVIEVEYNKELVEDYKSNYIMEEGIGADPDTIHYDIQSNINEVSLDNMIEEGEVIIEEVINND